MTWPNVSLANIIQDMQPGFACRPVDRAVGTPQLRTNNVSSEGRIDLSDVKYVPATVAQMERYALAPGDVLFNNTNSPALVGKTAFFSESGTYLFSNHMTRIRVRHSVAYSRYVAHFLHWTWRTGGFRRLVSQWVNQAAISRAQLASALVPLPTVSEQKHIVELLDQADALRQLRGKADSKAVRILPALFLKMFGDPATNPNRWDVFPLGDPRIGELDRGRSRHRPRNDPSLLGGPYPLIQTGDVARSDGRIRSYTQTYSELGLSQSLMWPAGTLCITIAANIAQTGVLEFDACFPDSVVGFIPGSRATTEYVQFFLRHLQPVLERNAPQAAQRNINLEVLRALPCPLPPRELQVTFSKRVHEHYAVRKRQLQIENRLALLFASMNLRAFTGALTAAWRNAHMRELQEEMEQQVRYLAASSSQEART